MRDSLSSRTLRFLRSNLLGLIAIFIALSGVAVALPGKNKVDSGDIKQGQVRTLDLHRAAVTKAKLRRNSVDGTRVRNNSLTDDDINESTLDLPLGQGVVGPREEADRERRITIAPAGLMPQNKDLGAEPPVEQPQFSVSEGLQQASFEPGEDNEAGAIVGVPLDRQAASGLQVRLLWDADGTGNVTWNVGFQTLGAGTTLKGAAKGTDVSATSTPAGTIVETTVLNVPPGTLQNGVALALTISRNADAPGDTLSVPARLRLVEIRYTATG